MLSEIRELPYETEQVLEAVTVYVLDSSQPATTDDVVRNMPGSPDRSAVYRRLNHLAETPCKHLAQTSREDRYLRLTSREVSLDRRTYKAPAFTVTGRFGEYVGALFREFSPLLEKRWDIFTTLEIDGSDSPVGDRRVDLKRIPEYSE